MSLMLNVLSEFLRYLPLNYDYLVKELVDYLPILNNNS